MLMLSPYTIDAMPNAARLRIALIEVNSQPWRRIEVPLSLSLRVFHDSIQAAFQWTNTHLWEFSAGEQRYSDFMEDNDWSEEPVIKAGARSPSGLIETLASASALPIEPLREVKDQTGCTAMSQQLVVGIDDVAFRRAGAASHMARAAFAPDRTAVHFDGADKVHF